MRFAVVGIDGFVSSFDRSLHSIPLSGSVAHDWRSSADEVAEFQHMGFHHLMTAFEYLKFNDPDEVIWAAAEEVSKAFLRIGQIASELWKRFSVTIRHDFSYCARLVLDFFRPKAIRRRPVPTRFAVRVPAAVFRRMIIDRVIDELTEIFTRLRRATRLIDVLVKRGPAPLVIGAHASRFVVRANRSEGRID